MTPISTNGYPLNVKITVSNFDLPYQSDASELLDKCVLLNTYLSSYFLECGYIKGFDICYRIDRIERTMVPKTPDSQKLDSVHFTQSLNGLFVSDLVLENTEAGEKVKKSEFSNSEYTAYNFVFTKLQKNLIREADGK